MCTLIVQTPFTVWSVSLLQALPLRLGQTEVVGGEVRAADQSSSCLAFQRRPATPRRSESAGGEGASFSCRPRALASL